MSDQHRRTLQRHALRPQSAQPLSGSPTLDSWLARVPSGAPKLTAEELRQWKLDDEGPRRPGRGLYMTAICLRVVSLVSAFIVAVLGVVLLYWFYDFDRYRLLPLIVPGVLICAWNTLEFLVVRLRKSRKGLPRLAHLLADGVICLLLVASIAGFWIALHTNDGWYQGPAWWWYSSPYNYAAQYVVALVFLIILLLIHATFILSFPCCGRRSRRDERIYTPRIMYLPDTGEAVVVLARPYPPKPTCQQQRQPPALPVIELDPHPAAETANPLLPVRVQPPPERKRQFPETTTAGLLQQAHVVRAGSGAEQARHDVPPRKPVPRSQSAGTCYATPWPADHVPDEAELARAARGESQAQWMTLGDSKPDRGNKSAAEDPIREGEKSDLVRGMVASAARKP